MSTRVQTDQRAQGGCSNQKRSKAGGIFGVSGGDAMRHSPLFYLSALVSFVCLSLIAPSLVGTSNALPLSIALGVLLTHAAALLVFAGLRRAREGALLSAATATGMISWVCLQTGGLLSPLLVLFVVPVIEALLTRRAGVAQATFAMVALGIVATLALGSMTEQSLSLGPNQKIVATMLGVLYALSLVARILRVASLRDVRAQATRRAINQFHAITHDMFITFRRDGAAEQVFGAVRQITGCDSEALAGQGFLARVHMADRPLLLASLDDVGIKGGRASVEVRLRTGELDAPQAFIWVEVDISVPIGPNVAAGAEHGENHDNEICALVRDITAVKDHAAELTSQREIAEAADAAKGRFLATMSHELRTPLNAIIGFADILDEEVFGALANEQQREYVGLIRDSGGHLLQLVNDLLDMSKLDAGHFQIVAEPFAFPSVVERCTRLVSQQIEKAGLTLHVDVPDTLPELVADQRAIRQVLINLLSNACKFTPQGGSITVRARNDNGTLLLSIIDTGIGIAAHELARLGEPFFQANNAYDRNHQGTGLGLSVVKGLCELHEGSLSFSSVEGEGTSVTVRLPLKGPSGQKPADVAQHAQANTVVLSKLQHDRTRTFGSGADTQEAHPDEARRAEEDGVHEENEGNRAYG